MVVGIVTGVFGFPVRALEVQEACHAVTELKPKALICSADHNHFPTHFTNIVYSNKYSFGHSSSVSYHPPQFLKHKIFFLTLSGMEEISRCVKKEQKKERNGIGLRIKPAVNCA